MQKNVVFYVPTNGAGEHNFLEISSLLNQILQSVLVRDARDTLRYDGPIVESFGDIVSRGADTAVVSLLVRFRTQEGRQERMVDIDDSQRVSAR